MIVRAGGVSVTAAMAVFVVSAALVAITVTACGEVMELGAVYKPLVEMTPTEGLSAQVTAVLVVPETDAVNCCICDAARVAAAGVIEIETVDPGISVTTATADLVGSAVLTATTPTDCWLVT